MKLGSQCLDDLLPVTMRCETPSRCTSDAVFTVELNVEWVVDVTAGTDGDPYAVVERGMTGWVRCAGRWRSTFGLVQLEADLREII